MKSKALALGVVLAGCFFISCREEQAVDQSNQQQASVVTADSVLYKIVATSQPFRTYTLFPNADSVTQGTLNGSSAHAPLVRVSMNATAFGALQNGRLPAGTTFPDGSIIFKEIRANSGPVTTLYAIIYKERNNPLSNNGWVWAEYAPDGALAYSITNRGGGCVSCHAREQGPQNDFVRTFERQR